MSKKSYALIVSSFIHAILCIGLDICNVVGIISQYKSNPEVEHWIVVKHILKYLKRRRDCIFVYSSGSLETFGYSHTYSNFQEILTLVK